MFMIHERLMRKCLILCYREVTNPSKRGIVPEIVKNMQILLGLDNLYWHALKWKNEDCYFDPSHLCRD